MGLAHLRRNEPLLARESVLECPSLWGHGRHLGRAVFFTPGLGASGKGDVGGRDSWWVGRLWTSSASCSALG